MRYLILTVVAIVVAIFIFLVLAVNDDKRWFHDFSKNQRDSVSTKSPIYFEHKVIKKIAELTAIKPPPPVISFTSVFALTENDSIVMTSIPKLNQVHTSIYTNQFQNFNDFLFSVLNQKSKLNTKDLSVRPYYKSIFKADTIISSINGKEGVTGLIKHYTLPNKNGYTLKLKNLSQTEINSLTFYFFTNKLIRQDDDYNATTYFKTLEFALDDIGRN